MNHEDLAADVSWTSRIASAVAATSTPRCTTHFLTKFENQSEKTLLSPLFAPTEVSAATTSDATPSSKPARALLVSKKHSGSLLMAPPFYAKNSTGNRFSRLGCLTLRNYMCAVWGEDPEAPLAFTRWWADAEAKGLCYSFELVVPRTLGDHGATPAAAYLVLTTAAITRGPNPRFLSPAEVISLATEWRLPLNEVWYFPYSAAPRVEAALHAARWTLKDSQVDALLGQAASSSSSSSDSAASAGTASGGGAAASAGVDDKGVKQGFLTHLETQGDVLEGFVLMALEVGDLSGLQQLVTTYNDTMAPWHDAALKQALDLGRLCHHRDAKLEALLGDNGGSGGQPSASVNLHRDGLSTAPAASAAASAGAEKPELVPAPEPQRVKIEAGDLWPLVCQASGNIGGLFRRLKSSYQHRIVLKAYRYTTLSSLAAAASSSSGGGGQGVQEVFQVQVEIHDDEVFYSWPMHARAGGCSPLYRGMVVQFDGHLDEESRRLEDGIKGLGLASGSTSSSLSQTSATGLEMRILGIAKLKCLNYLWRTFGVRNQLPTLLNEGEAAYVRRCQTGFFKNWSIPQEHRPPMLALFTGWAQFVKSRCSGKDREGLKGRSMYLDLLEKFLSSGDQGALRAAHLISGVGAGTTIGGGGSGAAAALAPAVADTATKKQEKAAYPPAGAPTVVVMCVLALPPGGGKSTLFKALRESSGDATVVSSDECTKAKKNFDAEVKTAIKSAAARLQRESRKNTGNSTSSQESFAVVGYDKNIPQPSGLTKLLKVLRPLAEGTEKGNAVPVNLRVALVMPEYLDWDVCWSRIEARDNSYLLNNCPPSVKGSMPPGECRKVFDNFYSLAKKWLPVAQDIAPEHAVVTPAFLPPSSTSSQGSDDGGRSACAQVIAELVGNFDQMSRRALSFADLDRAFQASEDKDAAGSSSMLGGGLGGGSLNGRAVWCSAPVDRTNLHLTLVPPPGSRESNETSRKDALDRMKAQHGKKISITVTKYHVADYIPPGKSAQSGQKSRRGGKGGEGDGVSGSKHVGLWEVDSVEGLIPGSELAIQAACYHITDVGSLRPGTKAKDAYEVLSTIIQPSRSSSASAEGDVSMGNTTATAAATPSAAEATAAAAASSISTQSSIPQVEPPSSSSGLGPTDVARMMMQRAIAAAQAAAAKGERCSGCVVALDNQVICEVGSGVQALKGDATATAPILAVRALMGSGDSKMHAPVHAAQAPLVPEADRSRCVVYCSEEPCAMGVGAFYWAGVGSIVFAASSAQVKALERKHGAAGRGGGVQGSGSSSTASAMDSEATGQTSIPSCSDLLTHAARPIPVQGGFLATAALSAMQQAFTSNNGEKLVTGRKRAAEDAADASKESTTTTTVRVKPATATEEACTVIESGGWTVTTHELPAPMRIEAFVTVHC